MELFIVKFIITLVGLLTLTKCCESTLKDITAILSNNDKVGQRINLSKAATDPEYLKRNAMSVTKFKPDFLKVELRITSLPFITVFQGLWLLCYIGITGAAENLDSNQALLNFVVKYFFSILPVWAGAGIFSEVRKMQISENKFLLFAVIYSLIVLTSCLFLTVGTFITGL